MLAEITIKDFAIIDQLTLQFVPGFNVLTGETGAGKSIILDAVSLLLGDRADTEIIRSGAEIAIVEGIFVLNPGPVLDAVNTILIREGLEGEAPDVLTLSREVRSGGRSLSRVNGRTVTLAVLREIGEGLIDIHGQSEHLSLLRPTSHIVLLDRFGELESRQAEFAGLVDEINRVRKELHGLLQDETQLQQRVELLTFKADEIEKSRLQPGEDDTLREEAHRLGNAEQLAALTTEAYQALYGVEEGSSAADRLSMAAMALSRLLKIDPEAAGIAELAENLSIQVEELGRALADYDEILEFDPTRLSDVELRISLISNLKRKYHADDIEGLLTGAEEARQELEAIEHSEERIATLQTEETKLLRRIGEIGVALTRARESVADELSRAIESELVDLRMESARFGVAIEQVNDPDGAIIGEERVAFDHTGIDQVEFLIAPNVGEPLKPVAKVASGGETARIMLALKTVLSRADETPTLIFDEIDQGIGGRIGTTVGKKLWGLSANHQVMVVTHLPQLAGFGDQHYKVEKQVVKKRTITTVTAIEGDIRVEELTAMLGAEAESARQSAVELLAYVHDEKSRSAASSG